MISNRLQRKRWDTAAASMEFKVVMVAIGIKFAMPGQEIPPKTGTFFR